MTCNIEFNTQLRNAGKKIQETLDLGADFTSDGRSLLLTKKTLMEALATPEIGKAKKNVSDILPKNIFHQALRKNLGVAFQVRYASLENKSFGSPKEVVLVDATLNGDEATVKLKDGNKYYTFKFDIGMDNDHSKYSEDGVRVYIPYIGMALYKAKKEANNKNEKLDLFAEHENASITQDNFRAMITALAGSTHNQTVTPKNLKNYRLMSDYVHGNVLHMKKMLHTLHALGHHRADKAYIEHAEKVLDSLHERFFNKMSLYIRENMTDTNGWVSMNPDIIGIDIARKNTKKKIYMTEAEVYLHEVLHSVIMWAFRNNSEKTAKIRRKIRYSMREAMKKTQWKDFLAVPENQANQEDIKRAKEIYEYIFTSNNAEEEFIVYGLSNPAVMKHFSKLKLHEEHSGSLLDKIMEFFSTLMDIVMGNYSFGEKNKTISDQLMSLMLELGEINSKASNTAKELNIIESINEWVNDIDSRIAEKMDALMDEMIDPNEKLDTTKSPGMVGDIVFAAKFIFKSITSKHYRQAAALLAENLGMKQEGTVQEFVASLMEEGEARKEANWLGLLTNKIDGLRNSIIGTAKLSIMKGFNRPLSDEQEVALTRVLIDTNATHLMYGDSALDNAQFREVLNNEKILKNRIYASVKRIKNLLKNDPERANWTIAQSQGLGYFMATHKGSVVQNLNARNIARGIHTNQRYKLSPVLIKEIDTLASLTALLYTDQNQKNMVEDLMKREFEGVKNIMNMYEAFKTASKDLFKTDPAHMITGYSKEILDDTIEIKYAPLSKRADMELQGYIFKGELKGRHGLVNSTPMAMYVSNSYSRSERQRGAVSLNALSARGSSLKEQAFMENKNFGGALFARNKALIQKEAAKITAQMKNGTYDVAKAVNGLVPTIDAQGKVIDYRYMMSKEQKEKLLNQDVRISEVLSRSLASVPDKIMRQQHNEKVLEHIKQVMKEQWEKGEFGKGEYELVKFRLIGPEVSDPRMRELYYMLPENFKTFINSRADKTMAVPADLMNIYLGYSHFKFTDLGIFKHVPIMLVDIINNMESLWIDLVKIVKGNILLKMPLILVGNIISNALFILNTGMDPQEVVKLHIESIRDVRAYIKKHREVLKLQSEIAALEEQIKRRTDVVKWKEEIYRKKALLSRLEADLESNPIKELVDLGMYQTVVEDVDIGGLGESNRITEAADRLLKHAPGIVKTPLQWLYLSKETSWYKINQEVLQISDLVARDVTNRHQKMIEKQQANGERKLPKEFIDEVKERTGVVLPEKGELVGEIRKIFFEQARKSRHYNLLKNFVNYTQPNGAFEEYLNRIGVLMFTKYVKNIQRIILKTGKDYPIRTLLTLMAGGWLFNADQIQDQVFLVKGWGQDGEFSITNIFPIYDPLDHIMTVVNPPLINLAQEFS